MNSLKDNSHCNSYPETMHDIVSKRARSNERKQYLQTHHSIPDVKGQAEKILKIYFQYDIRTIFTSNATLWKYLCRIKPPNRIQNKNKTKKEQELWVLHLILMWPSIQKRDMPPTKNKARGISKDRMWEGCRKVGYGRPYMRWSQNSRRRITQENKTS